MTSDFATTKTDGHLRTHHGLEHFTLGLALLIVDELTADVAPLLWPSPPEFTTSEQECLEACDVLKQSDPEDPHATKATTRSCHSFSSVQQHRVGDWRVTNRWLHTLASTYAVPANSKPDKQGCMIGTVLTGRENCAHTQNILLK